MCASTSIIPDDGVALLNLVDLFCRYNKTDIIFVVILLVSVSVHSSPYFICMVADLAKLTGGEMSL